MKIDYSSNDIRKATLSKQGRSYAVFLPISWIRTQQKRLGTEDFSVSLVLGKEALTVILEEKI